MNAANDVHVSVSECAHEIVQDNLTMWGNELTQRHADALKDVLDCMSALAAGFTAGRYAFGLPCGAGKTQAVVAWCAALHKAVYPYSVMIAASQVEGLCDLRRELLANGVPADKIGLWHSYKFDPSKAALAKAGDPAADGFASEETTGPASDRPILLVTHNRIRGKAALATTHYQGAPRNLVVWDESLLISEHRAVAVLDVEQGFGWFKPLTERDPEDHPRRRLANHLEALLGQLERELEAQRERAPRTIQAAPLDEAQLTAFLNLLREVDSFRPGVTRPLADLLRFAQAPMRAVRCSQGGGGYVQYEIVVPDELNRIVILDASDPIRDLVRRDASIKRSPGFNGAVKTYEDVVVHHMPVASGRGAMHSEFQNPRERRRVSREIIEVVKGVPADEAILMFTFKKRQSGPDIVRILKEDLCAAGLDVEARIPDGRARFQWLTWGQHTSLSDYKYCRNVIFAGVLHRNDVDLAGAMAAQSDNLVLPISEPEIADVRRSEIAHCIYQAMNRGAARQTIQGRAAAMRVWLMLHDKAVRDRLLEVMPGLRWASWRPSTDIYTPTKAEQLAERIASFLRGQPAGGIEVSTRLVKEALGAACSSASRRTFTNAIPLALELVQGWSFAGRSFVRSGLCATAL
jgi:hypothetical protein